MILPPPPTGLLQPPSSFSGHSFRTVASVPKRGGGGRGAGAQEAPSSLGAVLRGPIEKRTDGLPFQMWGSPVPTRDRPAPHTCKCTVKTQLFCYPSFLPFWGLSSNTELVFTS